MARQVEDRNPFQRCDWETFECRYESELQLLFRTLPLSESNIEHLVLPVIQRLAHWVQLLPASEFHHHAYPGGLFVHSLEAARYASRIASYETVFHYDSAQQKYHRRERWIVAAAVMLLIHDVGKVFDVNVCDRQGRLWNANDESLYAWLNRLDSREYLVEWRVNREHKAHELRSVRMAYQWLLPSSLIRYLTSDSQIEVTSAIEDAIVFGKGPLSEVLRRAESQSITDDLQSRHRDLSRQLLQLPLEAIEILDSVRTLLLDGLWRVNDKESFVFVTNEGVFLRLTPESVQAIVEAALIRGNRNVQSSVTGIATALSKAGLLTVKSSMNDYFWDFQFEDDTSELGGRRYSSCLLFKSPFALFDAKQLPKAAAVRLVVEEENTIPIEELQPRKSDPEKKTLSEDQVLKMSKDAAPETMSSHPLSESELKRVLLEPMTDGELKTFLPRLFDSVVDHCQRQSWLASEIVQKDDERTVISSLPLEQVLKNYKTSQKVVEIFSKLRKATPKIEMDFQDHFIVVMWR